MSFSLSSLTYKQLHEGGSLRKSVALFKDITHSNVKSHVLKTRDVKGPESSHRAEDRDELIGRKPP